MVDSTLEESHWVLLIPDPTVLRLRCAVDLGSVIIDCEFKHYNTVGGKGIPEC